MEVNATSFFGNLPVSLLTATCWALLAFAVGRQLNRHATIDVFWGSGFLVLYLQSLLASRAQLNKLDEGHTAAHWAVFAAVALWGLRLSIYLARRQIGSEEDSRYLKIMRGARGRNETLHALKMIYAPQALALWFVSIPLQLIAFSYNFDKTMLNVGFLVFAIGFIFEAVGDEQLQRFVSNPANEGKTMNQGLWQYTRHPNYFGDATVWIGFYIMACAVPWGFLTLLSPAVMIWLLTSLTGKPMLENKLAKTREGYAEYMEKTSPFIPRAPKRAASSS